MPCHADWLNDLSLMPPVSVTMQPRKLLPAAAPVAVLLPVADALDEAADADDDVLADEGALDELLPHAAISKLAAAAPTVAINAVFFTVSSRPGCRSPGVTGLPPKPRLPECKTC